MAQAVTCEVCMAELTLVAFLLINQSMLTFS